MSCCENIFNKCIFADVCDEVVDTGLVSDFDGVLTVRIEFNGTWQQATYAVAISDPIILPNTFNLNYTHIVQFIKPNGSLLNGTCYAFEMKMTSGTNNSSEPIPTNPSTKTCSIRVTISDAPDSSMFELCNGDFIPDQYLSGNVVIPFLAGKQIVGTMIVDNTPRQDLSVNYTTGGIIGSELFAGSLITIDYEQPI